MGQVQALEYHWVPALSDTRVLVSRLYLDLRPLAGRKWGSAYHFGATVGSNAHWAFDLTMGTMGADSMRA